MRKTILTLSLLLSVTVLSNALDLGDQIYIMGNTTATYLQQKENRQRWMWDDLSAELTVMNATIGIQADLYQPKRLKFGNPPDSLEHNEIDRRYFRYRDDTFTAYIGHYEKTLGRGLAFRSFNNLAFDEDNIVDGVMASTDIYDFADITALFGSWTEEGHDKPHKARGGEINLYPFGLFESLPDRMLGLKGELVSAEVDVGGVGYDLQMLGIGGSFNWDYFDVYSEYVYRSGYDVYGKVDNNYGTGIYVSGNVYIPYISIGGQFKDYHHLKYPFCDPPTVTDSGQSINDGGNEWGYMFTAGSRPFDELFVEGGYAKSEMDPEIVGSTTNTGDLQEFFFASNYQVPFDFFDATLEAGYTYWDESSLRVDPNLGNLTTGTLRKWPWGKLHYNPFDDHAISMEGEYESRTLHQSERTYTDRRWAIGYTFRSITGVTARYEDSNELVSERFGNGINDIRKVHQWIWYEGFVDIGSGRKLTLGYGAQRGGYVCSSGVCPEEAPSTGFKVEFTGS
ncbi:MAG: hypothetical protein GY771_14610, partial [bacterium]|nr:hypothetical protein [bacterium]